MDDSVNSGGSGRRQAFLEFMRRHEGELRGWIRRRVRCDDLTQEILQRTFCQAWGSKKFDPEHPGARAWIFTTTERLILDVQRSKESVSISLDGLDEEAQRDGSVGSRSSIPVDRRNRDPIVELIEQEKYRMLNVALGMLAAEQRDALERFYLRREGTQFQIAEAIGLTIAAFNSRLNRARKDLKRICLSIRRQDEWVPTGHDSGNGRNAMP